MSFVRRALTVPVASIGLLAASLPLSPAASAATSASCPSAASTRLVTTTVLGDPASYTQLWVHSPATTQTLVCFVLPYGLGSGAIVVDRGVGVTPPSVLPHSNPAACPFEVVNATDPVRLRIGYGRTVPTSVCITVGDDTVALTVEPVVGTDLPYVQIWRDGTGSVLDRAACAGLLLQAQAYEACLFSNERIA